MRRGGKTGRRGKEKGGKVGEQRNEGKMKKEGKMMYKEKRVRCKGLERREDEERR